MRVVIEPVGPRHGAALIAAHRDSRAHHAPWVQPFLDQDGFAAWLERIGQRGADGGSGCSLVAWEADSGALVGLIGLSQIVRGALQSAYLGYHGMAATAGRGLMTEAVGLAVRHAFGPLALHRVEANIQPGNHRSIALVRRLGFRQEGFSPRYLRVDGIWRDHERWARLADEG